MSTVCELVKSQLLIDQNQQKLPSPKETLYNTFAFIWLSISFISRSVVSAGTEFEQMKISCVLHVGRLVTLVMIALWVM